MTVHIASPLRALTRLIRLYLPMDSQKHISMTL